MVTDPVVMANSVSVTNKKSVAIFIAPTLHSVEILIQKETISIFNLEHYIIAITERSHISSDFVICFLGMFHLN